MTEIKMEYGEIEVNLNEIRNACGSLQPQGTQPIEGNMLECTRRLEETTKSLQNLLFRYQKILNQNISSTYKSVDFMRETDRQVSGNIKDHVQIQEHR
ncbi:hypothetical protein D3H55_19145 [Bacillus salacetis]|uniref:Uncharacterized protein n=1 Tax=Bacillus salacetis TaxID=2315464 RepID=A0A3A1QW59_9BACI|nr:YwqI/YxiC family protein [Bacillus salacetis]RIW29380.1 hypothetical protein D3H55_19145 [Bacillus salacetis]